MNYGTDRCKRLSARGRRALATSVVLLALLTASLTGTTGAFAAEPEDIRGPDVTIIDDDERTILEYRQGGVLRMVRIVPDWGKPYYLVPRDQTTGEEDLERADALLPSWVIIEF
jgi:hypothetical protein